MATKKELETKKELARVYYMQGEMQKTIAAKIGVSEATVGKWAEKGGWAGKRSAASITRPELVNKLLAEINRLLDAVADSSDVALIASLPDKLSKFAAVIEKLDKKANIVDVIEVFMAFNKWLQYRQTFDGEITPELIKAINHYQDLYISENIGKK
jgi:DNA-binding XRE family transcriptional regulator